MNCSGNQYINTNPNVFTNTIVSDVGLYSDLSYLNMAQIPSGDNQNVDLARPFNRVRSMHHCHNGYTINEAPIVRNTDCRFYTVGFTNQCLSSTVDNIVTHLVNICETKGKQGYCHWNQNKLNVQVKNFLLVVMHR